MSEQITFTCEGLFELAREKARHMNCSICMKPIGDDKEIEFTITNNTKGYISLPADLDKMDLSAHHQRCGT